MTMLEVKSRESLLDRAKAERAKRRLRDFIPLAWQVVEPGTDFKHNWHIDAISEHLEAVTSGQIKRLVINIPPGYCKPVCEDQLVPVQGKGLIPLKEIEIGDKVLTHKGRFKNVSAVHVQGVLESIRVTTKKGRVLDCAPDHPVLTPRGWVEAGELIPGSDRVASVKHLEDLGEKTMTANEAALLGYVVGDGSCRERGACCVTVHRDEHEEISHIVECAKSLGFDPVVQNYQGGRRASRVSIRGGRPSKVKAWLKRHGLLGCDSYSKIVPEQVMKGNRDIVAAFLGAYWACDGYVIDPAKSNRGSNLGCDSVNRDLLAQIQHLLMRFGIDSVLRKKTAKIKTKKQGDTYISWSICLSGFDSAGLFAKNIPMHHSKASRLRGYFRTEFDKVLYADQVLSVEPIEKKECRCLTVEEDHSFVASEIAVHNSRSVTVMWPCWEWIQKPTLRYLCASYSASLAVDHNVERRTIIQSEWYQRHWGHLFQLEGDDNQKTQFTNTKKGKMMTTGVGGTATGKGGERLICDDPLNPKQAASEAELESCRVWFGRTWQNRLRDKKNGAMVVVMQRLHDKDTTAQALEVGYEHLMIPAEYDPKRSVVTCIGWKDPREKKGDLLWPAHESHAEIEFAKRSMGSYAYAGQYQQSPHPDGGGVFKRENFRYYTTQGDYLVHEATRLSPFDMYRYSTIDLAFSKSDSADWTVVAVWGFGGGFLWLLDLLRARLSPKELADQIRVLENKWRYSLNWVEKGAYRKGEQTINYLEEQGVGVRQLGDAEGAYNDKYQRAMNGTPRIESHKVLFPSFSSWLSEYEGELLLFPNGSHDDQVDVTSYGIACAPWGGVGGFEFSGSEQGESSFPPALNRPDGW